MCYSNWRDIFNNVFVCVDFPEEWCGVRYKYKWDESNSGGTPSPMNEENMRKWAKNPQFLISPRKPCEVFISLG